MKCQHYGRLRHGKFTWPCEEAAIRSLQGKHDHVKSALTVYVLCCNIQILHLQLTHSSYYIHFIFPPHTLKVASNVPYWVSLSPSLFPNTKNSHTGFCRNALKWCTALTDLFSTLFAKENDSIFVWKVGMSSLAMLTLFLGLRLEQDPLLKGSVSLSWNLTKLIF